MEVECRSMCADVVGDIEAFLRDERRPVLLVVSVEVCDLDDRVDAELSERVEVG